MYITIVKLVGFTDHPAILNVVKRKAYIEDNRKRGYDKGQAWIEKQAMKCIGFKEITFTFIEVEE